MTHFKFFIPIVLLISSTLSAQDFKTFEKENVSLQYPSEWQSVDVDKKAEENPNNPMLKSILLEITADKNDEEAKSVEVIKLDMSGKNATLSQVQQFFEKMYSSAEGKIAILKKSSGEVNGYEYKSMTLKIDEPERKLLGVQRFLLSGNFAYVISVSSPLAEFASFKSTGDQILDSFKVD